MCKMFIEAVIFLAVRRHTPVKVPGFSPPAALPDASFAPQYCRVVPLPVRHEHILSQRKMVKHVHWAGDSLWLRLLPPWRDPLTAHREPSCCFTPGFKKYCCNLTNMA